MQRFKVEYQRFMQMQTDIEMAIQYLKNNEKDSAIRHLRFCLDMIQTETDFYGKDMPIDDFKESQRLTA